MSNIESASNVKDMLLNGASKEDLMKALEAEIESAQKEINENRKAQEQNKALNKARMTLIHAAIEYLIALGLVDVNQVEEQDFVDLDEAIREIEKEMMPQVMLWDTMKTLLTEREKEKAESPDHKSKNADDIIKKFLKSL